jgi:hypothetical protein
MPHTSGEPRRGFLYAHHASHTHSSPHATYRQQAAPRFRVAAAVLRAACPLIHQRMMQCLPPAHPHNGLGVAHLPCQQQQQPPVCPADSPDSGHSWACWLLYGTGHSASTSSCWCTLAVSPVHHGTPACCQGQDPVCPVHAALCRAVTHRTRMYVLSRRHVQAGTPPALCAQHGMPTGCYTPGGPRLVLPCPRRLLLRRTHSWPSCASFHMLACSPITAQTPCRLCAHSSGSHALSDAHVHASSPL